MNISQIHKLVLYILMAVVLLIPVACASIGGSRESPTETAIAGPAATQTARVPENQLVAPGIPWPAPRIHPSMFYDPASEQIFMFSGLYFFERRAYLHEVWALDTSEATWSYVGGIKPTDSLISFGFDEKSGQVISLNNSPRETWAYDLESGTWEVKLQEITGQPFEDPFLGRRFGGAMAYDAESDRLIYFGGGDPERLFAETWAYDYETNSWEEMQPTSSPSPRGMHPMVYDAESDRVILWGGYMEPGLADINVWSYDYNTDTWESLENVDGPVKPWERHGMAYMPETDRILLFSGMVEDEVVVGPETWYYEFNTNNWTRIEPETTPPKLAMYAFAYDPSAGKVVLFGGDRTAKHAGDISNELWLFDPVHENWDQVDPLASAQQ